MDYCSTCRRHLNGALVCPGCGAYAPDIAPLAVGTRAPAPETVAAPWQSPSHLWHDKGSGAEEGGEAPQEHPYDGSEAPAPTGRAARRRQRERWKKTQRRALVATAVALVGGGLTVTSMNRQSTDRTQAASAPDREAMGIAEEQASVPVPASATPADTNRSKGTSSSTNRSSTANAPHEQTATTPQATPTTEAVQQDSVTNSLTTVVSSAESRATSTVSDTTDAATQTAASPTPSATDGTDGTDTSSTDTSAATPAPTESSPSSPSGLCLLGLVCIS